jgi:NAD(P)-dependent dehydrogenase (short-subunit alcohol dehydrogenase family)
VKPFRLPGAVVVVTGASSGIGAATAAALEKAGARVAMGARRLDRLQALRATFRLPGEHLPLALDVTDPASVARAFAEVDARYGRLDALVANAGVGTWRAAHETPEEELRRLLDVNVAGVVRCVREAVPRLAKGGGGRICLVSSVAGRRGVPGMAVYSASKFALHGLADAMRLELADSGIAVSVLCPGLTRTEFFASASGEKGEAPGPAEGDSAEAVAAAALRCLETGAPEVHLASALSAKRWAGVISQIAPRFVDGRMRGYYERRRISRASSGSPGSPGSSGSSPHRR